MDKHVVPDIPTTQHVLEDIINNEVEILSKDLDNNIFKDANETLINTYYCYRGFKQLQTDVIEQDGLNSKLNELNQKLAENVANMKKQK